MNPILRTVYLGLTALCLAASPVAFAQFKPFIGMEIGAAYWDYEFLDDDIALALSGSLGVDYGDYLGIEVGYQNFGTMNYVANTIEGELEGQSFSAAPLFYLPVSSGIKVYLSGGSERLDFTEQSDSTPVFELDNDHETFFGLGLLLRYDENSDYRFSLTSHDGGDIIRLSIGGRLGILR